MIGIRRAYSLEREVRTRRPPKSVLGAPGAPQFDLESYLTGRGDKVLAQNLTNEQMHNMYILNTWIRSCVDKIVRRVVAVEPVVKGIVPFGKRKATSQTMRRADEVQNFLENPNAYFESLSMLRSKIARDTCIYDAAATEIVRDDNSNIYQLCSVSGPTVKFNVGKSGFVEEWDKAYYQEIDGKKTAEFAYNEIIYFMLYPRSGFLYGLSPLETLKSTVAADLYAAQYNMDFFANDATPKIALLFNSVGTQEEGLEYKMARWRDYFEQELRGQPHKPIFVANEEGTLDLRVLSMGQADMQFQEYSIWLLTKIMAVYGMQPFVMGIILPTTGRLNSEQQDEAFKEDAVKPQLRLFAEGINEYIIWDERSFGYSDVYLDYYGMDLVDDRIQSEIDERYLNTRVIIVNDVRDELGLPRVPWGYRPLVDNRTVPLSTDGDLPEDEIKEREEEDEATSRSIIPAGKYVIPSDMSPVETRMLRMRRKAPSGLTPEEEKEGIRRILRRVGGRRKYVLFNDVTSTPAR